MILTVTLGIYAVLSTLGLYYSVKRNIASIEKIEEVVGQIEESLDVLDSCYTKIDAKSKIEVLSDDPIVRELIQDIATAKDSILVVANKISDPVREDIPGSRKVVPEDV
jgi:hypothetical protein